MVAPDKLEALLRVSRKATSAMQTGADRLREAGDFTFPARLESASRGLGTAVANMEAEGTDVQLAALLSVAGSSLRLIQTGADRLRELGDCAYTAMLESAGMALAKAVHDATQDTVPFFVADVLADDEDRPTD